VMALPTGRSRKRGRRWRVQEELSAVDHLVLWIPCIGLLVGLHFGDVPWPWPQRGRKEKSKEALRVELVSGVQPNT